MIIARYIENDGQFDVELIALLNGKRVVFAEFTCSSEKELKDSTDSADYLIKGEKQ